MSALVPYLFSDVDAMAFLISTRCGYAEFLAVCAGSHRNSDSQKGQYIQ